MKGANNSYIGNIKESIISLSKGLKLTFKHLWEARELRRPVGIDDKQYFEQETGVITLQYPFESLPVPDNGRYRLHNEIEDCIVCDKCAKICPVNCIDIEPVKAVEDIGVTSDGTKKRIHAAKFDIDMAKCCFCGLCTTVCPTECLTMTKAYDFSEFDVKAHNYSFSEMTPLEIIESKKALEEANKAKEAAKSVNKKAIDQKTDLAPKAKFKPKVKGATQESSNKTDSPDVTAKPKFKPKVKGSTSLEEFKEEVKTTPSSDQKPKPKFRPKVKNKSADIQKETEGDEEKANNPKPKFRPKIKEKSNTKDQVSKISEDESLEEKPKPKFRPKIKGKPNTKDQVSKISEDESLKEKPKPKFRPKIKPKVPKKDEGNNKPE